MLPQQNSLKTASKKKLEKVVEIEKTTGGTDPLSPGDTFEYRVVVTNPATASSDLTGIAIYDPLPAGVAYVDESSLVVLSGSSTTPISENTLMIRSTSF